MTAPSVSTPFRSLPPVLLWGLVLTGVLSAQAAGVITEAKCAVVLSIVGVAHSALGFLRHGGSSVTPTAVFMFGMGLFGFFPTVWYAATTDFEPARYELSGLTALLAMQILLYGAWAASDTHREAACSVPAPPSAWVPGAALGLACLVVGVGINALGFSTIQHLAQPAGYAGAVLTTLSLVQAGRRINLFALVVSAALFAGFVALLFTGGGRLVLGGLAVALTMCVGFRWKPRALKPLILASLPPGLWLLASMRANRTANYLTGYRETGLESVVWPQRLFFDVIESMSNGRLTPGNGDTFFAAAVIWVPREAWQDKPVGFGTRLTEIYKPELLAVGHSEAALIHGEFVYNFGLWGLPVLTVFLWMSVAGLNKWWRTADSRPVQGLSTLISQAVMVTLSAGLLDLVWVGTFTYISRAGFTCAILGLLLLGVKIFRLGQGPPPKRSAAFSPHQRRHRSRANEQTVSPVA